MNLDCKRIGNALNAVVEKCCKSLGYEKTLCRFAFVEDDDVNVSEYLDYASKLQQIGVTLDI